MHVTVRSVAFWAIGFKHLPDCGMVARGQVLPMHDSSFSPNIWCSGLPSVSLLLTDSSTHRPVTLTVNAASEGYAFPLYLLAPAMQRVVWTPRESPEVRAGLGGPAFIHGTCKYVHIAEQTPGLCSDSEPQSWPASHLIHLSDCYCSSTADWRLGPDLTQAAAAQARLI